MALFVLLLAPLAAAGPVTNGCYATAVCINEYESVDGSCEQGFAGGGTGVNVADVVTARGFYECWGEGGFGGGDSGVFVGTPAGSVYWIDFFYNDPENGEFHGCYLYVAGQTPPCPGSPPNPGWGHALP